MPLPVHFQKYGGLIDLMASLLVNDQMVEEGARTEHRPDDVRKAIAAMSEQGYSPTVIAESLKLSLPLVRRELSEHEVA